MTLCLGWLPNGCFGSRVTNLLVDSMANATSKLATAIRDLSKHYYRRVHVKRETCHVGETCPQDVSS